MSLTVFLVPISILLNMKNIHYVILAIKLMAKPSPPNMLCSSFFQQCYVVF